MRIAIKRGLVEGSILIAALVTGVWLTSTSVPVEVSEAYFVGELDPASTDSVIVPKKQRFVAPGNVAVFRLVGEKFRNCPALVAGKIVDVDGDPFSVAVRIGQLTASGPFDTLIAVPIPDDASVGWARYSERVNYGINFLAGCFQPYVIGPPERPPVRFCIGRDLCKCVTSRVGQ